MDLDVLIFGGGAAGLWLLDDLSRRGVRVLLLEAGRLGHGQTVASQGILHGGLKYALQGFMTPSAREVREMPGVWKRCLLGQAAPDLSGTRVRAAACHLWQTESLKSRLGMVAAKLSLHVAPVELAGPDRPPVFGCCRGPVYRLDEQVISPATFTDDLARQHRDRILRYDFPRGLQISVAGPGVVARVALVHPQTGQPLEFCPRQLVLTAGAGNAELRRLCGLPGEVMQRRPLHMVLVRGSLPVLNGHCIDGARTRVTVTSDCDAAGRVVWQVGGQLAEDGVALDETSLVHHARAELEQVLPGVDFSQAEWAAYRVDRAEHAHPQRGRPETALALSEGKVITGWPTKLVLAPQLAKNIAALVPSPAGAALPPVAAPADWPRPDVALPPWDESRPWRCLAPFRRSDAA